MCVFYMYFLSKIVNRIQKLRKKAGFEPTDIVEVYFETLDQDKSISQRVLFSQVMYLFLKVQRYSFLFVIDIWIYTKYQDLMMICLENLMIL